MFLVTLWMIYILLCIFQTLGMFGLPDIANALIGEVNPPSALKIGDNKPCVAK